ncbi:universal stress protein [Halosegnis longus]|uniref:Universal stress protein n=1 Tax=Halosegnis longus TaxID=2216012 RepID=A0AAJ4R985_9EURY|nr:MULTISPECIES: universal stress protein [Halobacteriales]RNJ26560.1 universal stress protein [Salella cibi]
MVLFVPFDGSPLSEAALLRAVMFSTGFDAELLAVTVLPQGNTAYARDRDWLRPGESFDRETIETRVTERVHHLAPEATVRFEYVDRHAPAGTIAARLRRVAKDADASVVFIGSENAGTMVTSLSSVAGGVTADRGYDVMLVRSENPFHL